MNRLLNTKLYLFHELHRPAYIDFDEMTVDGPLVNFSVRRNTLLSYNQKEVMGWYYKDNHRWCEYGSQVSGTRNFLYLFGIM